MEMKELFGFTTGSTLLNLAITNNPYIGYVLGKFYHIYGEEGSGKSFIAMQGLFHALQYAQKNNLNPILVYNDAEGGFLDSFLAKLNPEMYQQIVNNETFELIAGSTFEEVFSDFIKRLIELKDEEMLFYVVDSLDALITEDRAKADLSDASYGTEIAKRMSEVARRILATLKRKNAILFVISQVRESIGGYVKRETYSGGRGIRHAIHVDIYLKRNQIITKKINNRDYPIGVEVTFTIKKNRIAAPFKSGQFSIYFDSGIDDIGSCLLFLKQHGKIERSGAWLKWKDVRGNGIDGLVKAVIEAGKTNELRNDVAEVWHDILEKSSTGRPSCFVLWE